MYRTTTKNDNLFVRIRLFRCFVVVFFVFISFRRLSRLLRVANDRFFVVLLSFSCVVFFQMKLPFFDSFFVVSYVVFFFKRNRRFLIVFCRLIAFELVFLYKIVFNIGVARA